MAGEPDFDTPERIKRAAVEALRKGMTKYTEVRGIEPLREAIVEKYQKEFNLRYDKNEILVSCGAKHSVYNIFQALLDPGDEVAIPAPYWVSYSDMVQLAGGVSKIMMAEEAQGFCITPDKLESSLGPRTRAVIINSPSNPTGAAYSRDDLLGLSRVLERHDCIIISDDIYEKIVYDNFSFHNIVTANPSLRDRTVIVNGVSKSYAMTGWRIGYALGSAPLLLAAGNIQGQSTSNPTSIAQAAALEALRGPQEEIKSMVGEFQKRRDTIVRRLRSVPGINCFNPRGAFYVFPNFGSYLGKKFRGKKMDSACDLAGYFLEEAGVATVPGEDFGSAENIRFSYATSMNDIEKGCERIAEAVQKLT